MQIDWITVLAQIANFLVLVWLLRRLLYGPITRAMEEREANIHDRFDEADRRKAEAEEERIRLHAEREELHETREALIARARDDARELQQRLEDEARAEVEESREAWKTQLRKEQADFLHELRENATEHVTNVIRLALRDFASADLEEAMVETFVNKLRQLDGKTIRVLRTEAEAADGIVSVTSAFELAPSAKARLTRVIRETFHPQADVKYRRDVGIGCGFNLKIRGQTVQWSIDAYLDDLEEEIQAYFEAAEDIDSQAAAGQT